MNDRKTHWENVYRTKRPDEVSWYQREPSLSLELIGRAVPAPSARIIDVGGGASTLVDGLLNAGYSNLTVLDLSATALAESRERLGESAARVQWLGDDVLSATLPEAAYDLWHDRAVFHFLTDAADRAAYVAQVRRAVRPRGHVIVAAFAEDGPLTGSGLPVARYSPETLQHEFDGGFEIVESVREHHVTPGGSTQSFLYCLCRFMPHRSNRAV